jgi:hypothetical protein
MKINTFLPVLMMLFLMLCSCAILSINYYKPEGPGVLSCKHPSGWAGPRDKIRYEMPGNSSVELFFGSYYHTWSPSLIIGFNISEGYTLKMKSNEIEIHSAALEAPLKIIAEYGGGRDSINRSALEWKFPDDIIGGRGIYQIVIENIKIPEFDEFVVKFPEYYLNGEKFQIPTTTFKREKGTFVYPIAGGF